MLELSRLIHEYMQMGQPGISPDWPVELVIMI